MLPRATPPSVSLRSLSWRIRAVPQALSNIRASTTWPHHPHGDNATQAEQIRPTRGRPKKSTKEVTGQRNGQPLDSNTPQSKKTTPSELPLRLAQASQSHHDLPSFLAHAARTGLSPASTVYKGTHYEYTVARALQSYNFSLHRTGRSNDLGVDLIGTFNLPIPDSLTSDTPLTKRVGRPRKVQATSTSAVTEMRVIVQCKATNPQPSMVRELEGAYVGAPAGWRGEGVLALLVASGAATKGVRDALQRSRWPMALMQVTAGGSVKQFVWNAMAAEAGLEGMGVTVRYGATGGRGEERRIALTWMGKVIPMTS